MLIVYLVIYIDNQNYPFESIKKTHDFIIIILCIMHNHFRIIKIKKNNQGII